MWRAAGNTIVRVLLAPACAGCHESLASPLDGPVCPQCWMTVPRMVGPLCSFCGDMLPAGEAAYGVCGRCLASPPAFEVARSAGQYAGSLKRLIHAFKYEKRRMLAAPLAALVADRGREILEQADAVVPVPLHPWRALHRGFNQADDLAECLGRPVWRVLRRRRAGPPQASLPAHERAGNVSQAFARRFAISPGTLGPRRLQHRAVVLVDDVMTTGATLDACSRVLLDAGVRSVTALTVARAVTRAPASPPRPPDPWSLPR